MTGVDVFPVPIYGGRVMLCIKRDAYDRAHTSLEASPYKHTKDVRGVTSRHVDGDNKAVYLIGVFEDTQQTLVHELAHATFYILSHAGVPVTPKNDEAFAYLIDALFGECQKAIKRLRRRKS